MKRIGLAAGIVLLAFLAAVAVGNHSAGGTDKPPVVEWKAVPYGPVTVPLPPSPFLQGPSFLVTSLSFTAPEAGFVWVNSTGFCTLVPITNTISAVLMGWRTGPSGPGLVASPGDAFFNNIPTTANVGESLPYGASAVFPVLAGTGTLFLQIGNEVVPPLSLPSFSATCQGVNVVMFTNTQLP